VTSFWGGNFFSGNLGKQVASIQTATELKPNTLQTNFLHTNVGENLTFAMMIPKVEIFHGRFKGAKTTDFEDFWRFQPVFSLSVPTSPTKVAEKVYLGVLQHPINLQSEILIGKFYS